MSVLKKSVIAGVGYGVFGSLGLACLFFQYTMAVFNDWDQYPYLSPFSLAVGALCLLICAVILTWNIWFLRERRGKEILRLVGLEVLLTAVLLIPCLYGWDWLVDSIGTLF